MLAFMPFGPLIPSPKTLLLTLYLSNNHILVTHRINKGIVDSLMLYALAIGFFQQAIYPFQKPVQRLWMGVMACGIIYGFLPFTIVQLGINSFALVIIIMAVDGYLQSYAWPNLLMLVNSQYDNK
jgi:hypothetical protein